MNIICQSLYYQYILERSIFFKSPTTFRVIIKTILCCPCYMPKYVPMLEGIILFPSGRAQCLLTLGHISAYNMDNTILLYKYIDLIVTKLYLIFFTLLCFLSVAWQSKFSIFHKYCLFRNVPWGYLVCYELLSITEIGRLSKIYNWSL